MGFFDMKFSKNLFDGFVLEKASTEHRQTRPLAVVNVFSYKTKGSGPAIKLRFEASPTVSDIKDGYPRSFHQFSIFLDQGLSQSTPPEKLNKLFIPLPAGRLLKPMMVAWLLCTSQAFAGDCKENCILTNRSQDQSCALDKTPLTRCGNFSSYMAEDSKLNAQYRSLVKKLNSADAAALRTTQRAWLQWRLDKCDEADEASGCDNGVCAGVAHDACIIAVTRDRTLDFVQFSNDPANAARTNFSFSHKDNARTSSQAGSADQFELLLAAFAALDKELLPASDASMAVELNVSPPAETGLPAGVSPSAIQDLRLRTEYMAALDANQKRAKIASQQRQLRDSENTSENALAILAAKATPQQLKNMGQSLQRSQLTAQRKARLTALLAKAARP
ncbi:DUF1311 domain-containing protein [Duganella sp. BJB475]|nr:DUF1311 domain-containing protein [Duganella sp. BJB475]RFP35895.1 DUF1311 domain-containing protein [Duganella sp. BJB476]